MYSPESDARVVRGAGIQANLLLTFSLWLDLGGSVSGAKVIWLTVWRVLHFSL